MATTQIKNGFDGGSDDQLLVNPDGSINTNVTGGTIIATNPSVGPTGSPAPADATEIGGVDAAGNLIPILVTSSGQVEVTGTLTVGQGFGTLSPGYPTQVSIGTTSILVLIANSARKYGHIFNNSTEAIYVQFQATAALNQGIKVGPGTFFTLETTNLWLGDVNAIGVMAGQLVSVVEGI